MRPIGMWGERRGGRVRGGLDRPQGASIDGAWPGRTHARSDPATATVLRFGLAARGIEILARPVLVDPAGDVGGDVGGESVPRQECVRLLASLAGIGLSQEGSATALDEALGG